MFTFGYFLLYCGLFIHIWGVDKAVLLLELRLLIFIHFSDADHLAELLFHGFEAALVFMIKALQLLYLCICGHPARAGVHLSQRLTSKSVCVSRGSIWLSLLSLSNRLSRPRSELRLSILVAVHLWWSQLSVHHASLLNLVCHLRLMGRHVLSASRCSRSSFSHSGKVVGLLDLGFVLPSLLDFCLVHQHQLFVFEVALGSVFLIEIQLVSKVNSRELRVGRRRNRLATLPRWTLRLWIHALGPRRRSRCPNRSLRILSLHRLQVRRLYMLLLGSRVLMLRTLHFRIDIHFISRSSWLSSVAMVLITVLLWLIIFLGNFSIERNVLHNIIVRNHFRYLGYIGIRINFLRIYIMILGRIWMSRIHVPTRLFLLHFWIINFWKLNRKYEWILY